MLATGRRRRRSSGGTQTLRRRAKTTSHQPLQKQQQEQQQQQRRRQEQHCLRRWRWQAKRTRRVAAGAGRSGSAGRGGGVGGGGGGRGGKTQPSRAKAAGCEAQTTALDTARANFLAGLSAKERKQWKSVGGAGVERGVRACVGERPHAAFSSVQLCSSCLVVLCT